MELNPARVVSVQTRKKRDVKGKKEEEGRTGPNSTRPSGSIETSRLGGPLLEGGKGSASAMACASGESGVGERGRDGAVVIWGEGRQRARGARV